MRTDVPEGREKPQEDAGPLERYHREVEGSSVESLFFPTEPIPEISPGQAQSCSMTL